MEGEARAECENAGRKKKTWTALTRFHTGSGVEFKRRTNKQRGGAKIYIKHLRKKGQKGKASANKDGPAVEKYRREREQRTFTPRKA